MLLVRSAPLGLAPAIVALGVALLASLAVGTWACRRAPRGAWIREADRALALEGRLDAAWSVLLGRSRSRLADLLLLDAERRAAPLKPAQGVRRPRLARLVWTGIVAVALAILATFVPPVRAASAPAAARWPWERSGATQPPPVTPPAEPSLGSLPPPPPETANPAAPEAPPPEQTTQGPPHPNPDEPQPQPKPQPGQPQPNPEAQPLGPPPPAPDVRIDRKFLQPLLDEGPLREKEAYTPQPDSGTREAQPLAPEELRRVYPQIRKRAEASLPRQAFSEEERRVVRRYFEALVPH